MNSHATFFVSLTFSIRISTGSCCARRVRRRERAGSSANWPRLNVAVVASNMQTPYSHTAAGGPSESAGSPLDPSRPSNAVSC